MTEKEKTLMVKILTILVLIVFLIIFITGFLSKNNRDFNQELTSLRYEEHMIIYRDYIKLSETINLLTRDIAYYLGELLIDYTDYSLENIDMGLIKDKYQDRRLYMEIENTIEDLEDKQYLLEEYLKKLNKSGIDQDINLVLEELNEINRNYIYLVKNLDCSSDYFMDRSKKYRISYKEGLVEAKKLLGRSQ